MATAAMKIRQEQQQEILQQFLCIAIDGLEKEHKLLAAARSEIHSTAMSIYFAYCEVVYAYLIRRSLAVKGFAYQISYEEPYPSFPIQRVDLQIALPGDVESPVSCGIEMKWVVDEGDKPLADVLNDITKLLAEPAFQRRFVLLFPMFQEDRPVDPHHFAEHLQEFRAKSPTNWRAFDFKVIGQRSFASLPHDFSLALIEVSPAA